MARITRPEMLAALVKADVPFYQITVPGGGTAMLSQRGARILGLFPGDDDDVLNALWTHERIGDVVWGAVRDWVAEGMGSIGGERLWISPERNWYYLRPITFEGWFCPRGMDPGEYERIAEPDCEIAYRNTFQLEDMITGETFELATMTRRFQGLENPLSGDLASRLGYAGVRKTDSIDLPEATANTVLNLWTLALVDPTPADGVATIVVPVKPGAQPVDYFGGLTDDRLVTCDDHVAFKIDGKSVGKLGIRPEDIDLEQGARIGAFLPSASEDRLLLVIQRSNDVPRTQDECFDVAKADPDGPKGVVQAYNSGPGNDPAAPHPVFGEAEIQLARATPPFDGEGLAARATSDLMAFEGPRDDVLAAGCSLLGIADVHLF